MDSALLLTWIERLLAAALAGGMIGLERELRGKPAGLRTMVLITMGAALYMIGNEIIGGGIRFSDPARIAAQIVSGVGFLGAGAIITSRNKVLGLTTAAIIWFTAAVGLVIGYGKILFGLIAAGIAVAALVLLTQLEKHFLHPWARRHGFAHVNGTPPDESSASSEESSNLPGTSLRG